MAPKIDDFISSLKNKKESRIKSIRPKESTVNVTRAGINARTSDAVMKALMTSSPASKSTQTIEKEKYVKNRIQSGDKAETNGVPNGGQIGDKSETINIQKSNTITLKRPTGDKLEPKTETILETKWRQNGDVNTNLIGTAGTPEKNEPLPFSSLVGIQRQLTVYIYESCKHARESSSPPLTLEFLSNICRVNKASIKKSLRRLEDKRIVVREGYKNGRGGWSRYSLSKSIYQEILFYESKGQLFESHLAHMNIKNEDKWRQSEDNMMSKSETQPGTTRSSSSSSSYNTTTTTTDRANIDSFKADTKPLQHIGFTRRCVAQLLGQPDDKKLTLEQIQKSINGFAFDLLFNNKSKFIKGKALDFFMGILLKGVPYTLSHNYSDHDGDYWEKMLAEKIEPKSVEKTQYPTADENKGWFTKLSEEEKYSQYNKAMTRYPYLEWQLENAGVTIFSDNFINSSFFLVLMQLIGRAKE